MLTETCRRRVPTGAIPLLLLLAPIPAQADAGAAAPEPAVLSGTVLLADGTPAAGATVELRRYLLLDTGSIDVVNGHRAQQVLHTTCGDDGTFHAELPRGVPFELRTHAGRSAIEVLRRVYAGETPTIRLRRGALLEGVVTHEADGRPARAQVRAWAPVSGVELLRGETDDAGHYVFAQLPPETITLEVQPDTGKEPGWARLVLVAGRTLRHDVQVERLDPRPGRVIDATTGQPIAGAEVSDSWTFDRVARSDAKGSFELHGPQWDELHARAPGYGKICIAPGAGARDFEVALQPGRKVRGTIVDTAGRPLAGVYVAATADARVGNLQQTDWLPQFTGADGRFAFDAVRRDIPHCLFLRRDGHATLVYDFPHDEAQREEIDFGTLTLPPAIYLTGRVTDEHGVPIVGTPVSLGGNQDDRYRFCDGKQDKDPRGGFYVNGRHTVTDSLGRFHFADLGVGRYRVRARVEQVTPRLVGSSVIETETATVVTKAGQTLARHDFTIKLGRNLRGGVMTASGEAPPPVSLRFGDADQSDGAKPLLVQTGIPFRLFQLPAGKITLEAAPCDAAWGQPLPDDDRVAVRVLDEIGDGPVWLCLPAAQWVQAFVVDAAGKPVVGVEVEATGAGGTRLGTPKTDERGSVSVFLGEEKAARLRLPSAGSEGRPLLSELLAAGTANTVLVRR
ncbi:MAG: carboxypeptidase regulatory-like domain-containing protein [Planctomycetota bacterium]